MSRTCRNFAFGNFVVMLNVQHLIVIVTPSEQEIYMHGNVRLIYGSYTVIF